MAIIVSFVGVFTAMIGLISAIQPGLFIGVFGQLKSSSRFWAAIIARALFAVTFFVAAPACRFPIVIYIVGGILIAAAITVLIVGQQRLNSFIDWWLARPGLIRVSALLGVAFGILLLCAGA